jgi:hypothetical protein
VSRLCFPVSNTRKNTSIANAFQLFDYALYFFAARGEEKKPPPRAGLTLTIINHTNTLS